MNPRPPVSSKGKRSRSQGHKVQKHIGGDHVVGVGLTAQPLFVNIQGFGVKCWLCVCVTVYSAVVFSDLVLCEHSVTAESPGEQREIFHSASMGMLILIYSTRSTL